MDYNELKLAVLRIVSDRGPIKGESILTALSTEGVNLDVHAVRMALMRYYRLGLLKRVKTGGAFTYSLSERGIARLGWLERQKNGKSE